MNLAGKPAPGLRAEPVVSRRLRDSACGETCTLRLACCNSNPETTVLAHIRHFGWAGTAQKPPDFLAVYACATCHDAIDGRGNVELWGWDDLLRALGETQIRMHRKGLLRV